MGLGTDGMTSIDAIAPAGAGAAVAAGDAAGAGDGRDAGRRGRGGGHGRRRRRVLLGVLVVVVALLVAAGVALVVYASDPYRADVVALSALRGDDAVRVERLDARGVGDGYVFLPADESAAGAAAGAGDAQGAEGDVSTAGLIFYPGGKVQPESYAPLMRACASRGVTCVLLEMPLNLAVLDPNAADGVAAQFPQVSRWYVGGHSLGGAMAATYAAGHADELAGLVLLGSYSTADLSGSGLEVLSAYGTEDGVMNREHYARDRANLPADARELVIEGGCHAGFGDYGAQAGDGTPTISCEEQQAQTADAIAALCEA